MVKRIHKNCGFSLMEALVSMLVLSMFFLATSKIATNKPKQEPQHYNHGYFECFVDNTNIMKQKRADGSYAGEPIELADNTCKFTPPSSVAFVLVYALNNSSGRRFYVSTEPQFTGESEEEGGAAEDNTITITRSELAAFHTLMELDDATRAGNDRITELKNFLQTSYPSSSIYELLEDNPETYSGPAVFIGW